MNIYERLHSKGVLNVATGCIEYSGYRSNGYGIIKLNGEEPEGTPSVLHTGTWRDT